MERILNQSGFPEPFYADRLIEAVHQAGDPARRAQWSVNATRYGRDHDLYGGMDRVLGAILGEA